MPVPAGDAMARSSYPLLAPSRVANYSYYTSTGRYMLVVPFASTRTSSTAWSCLPVLGTVLYIVLVSSSRGSVLLVLS